MYKIWKQVLVIICSASYFTHIISLITAAGSSVQTAVRGWWGIDCESVLWMRRAEQRRVRWQYLSEQPVGERETQKPAQWDLAPHCLFDLDSCEIIIRAQDFQVSSYCDRSNPVLITDISLKISDVRSFSFPVSTIKPLNKSKHLTNLQHKCD